MPIRRYPFFDIPRFFPPNPPNPPNERPDTWVPAMRSAAEPCAISRDDQDRLLPELALQAGQCFQLIAGTSSPTDRYCESRISDLIRYGKGWEGWDGLLGTLLWTLTIYNIEGSRRRPSQPSHICSGAGRRPCSSIDDTMLPCADASAASSRHRATSKWKMIPDGKRPYFISAADGGVLSIAGLWDRWHSTDGAKRIVLHQDRHGRECPHASGSLPDAGVSRSPGPQSNG
jgi:hypothetical protein